MWASGPLHGLCAEMKSLGVSTVGDLRPPRVLANAVMLGILTLDGSPVNVAVSLIASGIPRLGQRSRVHPERPRNYGNLTA